MSFVTILLFRISARDYNNMKKKKFVLRRAHDSSYYTFHVRMIEREKASQSLLIALACYDIFIK